MQGRYKIDSIDLRRIAVCVVMMVRLGRYRGSNILVNGLRQLLEHHTRCFFTKLRHCSLLLFLHSL